MGNVVRVLKRDIMRLLRAPAALAVVLALLVLPSAYTWYNVIAFWNPYDNTGNLRVCVVNEDAGGESDVTGAIDVGDMIVAELAENTQLAWEFTDRDTAMDELAAGKSYAAFVIPEDFTANLLNVVDGDFVQPKIDYYVNEKAGPVSPKITDTGATTLDDQVNAAFTAEVSDAVVKAADGAIADAGEAFSSAQSRAAEDLADVAASVANARAVLSDGQGAAESARGLVADAKSALERAKGDVAAAADAVEGVGSAVQGASDKLGAAADAIGQASGTVQEQAGALRELAGRADAIASETAGTPAGDAAAAIADAARRTADAAVASTSAFGDAVSSITGNLAALSGAASSLAGAIAGQQALIDEAGLVLDHLDASLGSAGTAAAQTADVLGTLEDDLATVRTDILALGGSSALAELADGTQLDAAHIASFMESPTTVETVELYPLNAYGSAMAPLFMSLTFWIGAFMLVIIMRQEVDGEGVGALTSTERYLSRFVLFALLAVVQSAICCAGVIAIGVQTASAPALFCASAAASLAYMSIIYALSAALRHIGKGLCIVAVFAQIPGATGLYPTEMTSSFFQAVYPAFPFTYGIDALREAIFGFCGVHFAVDVAVLGAFFAVFLGIGLAATPLLGNVSRLMARQVREGGLYNGEGVIAPARPYRFSQLFRAVFEKESYREEIRARYEAFSRRYPKMLRGALVGGIVVPATLVIVFALTPTEKVVILTLLLAWLVGVLVFLVVVESLRASLERQLELEAETGGASLSDELREGAVTDEAGDGDA